MRILVGDCRDVLQTLPDESVHCCVSSPPYFGLRDYGVEGQIGLEPTLDAYLDGLVGVFREVRRVLRSDGTLWLNIGDSYANDGKWGGSSGGKHVAALHGQSGIGRNKVSTGLKPKDLMMVPARLALALQADGWWVRSDIIWHKPNPMPESVTDRPTSAHEHIFLLTKSAKYWYDAAAVAEPAVNGERFHGAYIGSGNVTQARNGRIDHANTTATRNLRNVWTITPKPFKGAHFATFPPDLAERCIKAGCPEGGAVLDPFLGSGTTLLVADRLGRNGVGIELNPDYAEMARERIYGGAPLFQEAA